MTEENKASRYDEILRLADKTNQELSKLKSENIGINSTHEKDRKIHQLKNKLSFYENEMKKLFTI